MKEFNEHSFKSEKGNAHTAFIKNGEVFIEFEDCVFKVSRVAKLKESDNNKTVIAYGDKKGCIVRWQDADYVNAMLNCVKKNRKIMVLSEDDRTSIMSDRNFGEEFTIGGNEQYLTVAYKYQ